MKYLAIVDVDQLQSYVFEAPKLREIRGASALVADIGSKEQVTRLLHNSGIGNISPDGTIMPLPANEQLDWRVLTSTAGVTRILFNDSGKANAYVRAHEQLFHKKGISVTSYVYEQTSATETLSEMIGNAEHALKLEKAKKAYTQREASLPYLQRCGLCSMRPAQTIRYNNEFFICDACAQKGAVLTTKGDTPIERQIKKYLDSQIAQIQFPNDISEIATHQEGKKAEFGYLGFLYMDGNGWGTLLQDMNDPLQYFEISRELIEGMHYAVAEAANRVFAIEFNANALKKMRFLPFVPLIMGGDDLLIMTRADAVLPMAQYIVEEFNAYVQMTPCFTAWQNNPPGFAAGAVIAHDSFPIRSYQALGKMLCKSSKQLVSRLSTPEHNVSVIDFQVVSSAVSADREAEEKQQIVESSPISEPFKAYRLTGKPYVISGIDYPFTLQKLYNQLKLFKSFPNSKLGELRKQRLWITESFTERKISRLSYLRRLGKEHLAILDAFAKEFGLNLITSEEGDLARSLPQVFSNPQLGIMNIFDLIELKEFYKEVI